MKWFNDLTGVAFNDVVAVGFAITVMYFIGRFMGWICYG